MSSSLSSILVGGLLIMLMFDSLSLLVSFNQSLLLLLLPVHDRHRQLVHEVVNLLLQLVKDLGRDEQVLLVQVLEKVKKGETKNDEKDLVSPPAAQTLIPACVSRRGGGGTASWPGRT